MLVNEQTDHSNLIPRSCPNDLGNAKVTYLPNIRSPELFEDISLNEALKAIGNQKYKAIIDRLRTLDEKAYKQAKRNLPAIAFNGVFAGKVVNDSFQHSSGLFHFDIDGLDANTLAEHKAKIAVLPEVVFVFESPSGKGLKGAIRIHVDQISNDADFKMIFKQIALYLQQNGYTIDKTCKDVRRLCFVSYDPDIYINWQAQAFAKLTDAVPIAGPAQGKTYTGHKVKTTEDICFQRLTSILQGAAPGERHTKRLKAGHLAGGYIAGGLLNEEQAWAMLMHLSNQVGDESGTSQPEQKTLIEAIHHGKQTPIRCLFRFQPFAEKTGLADAEYNPLAIIDAALAELDEDIAAWRAPEALAALHHVYSNDYPQFDRICHQLSKAKTGIVTALKKEISIYDRKQRHQKQLNELYLSSASALDDSGQVVIRAGSLVSFDEEGKPSVLIDSKAVVILAEALKDVFAYSVEAKTWHQFSGTHWAAIDNRKLENALFDLLSTGTAPVGFTNNYKNNVKALLADSGLLLLPVVNHGLLPFQNGLLDYQSTILHAITPHNAQTWVLPYQYDPQADCPMIKTWLFQAVDGDQATVKLLQAWLAALLHGRADLQIFLHLLGSGGTGKGTFMRLAAALVGQHNATSTNLQQMESNRFETANFYNKRMVCITDSDKYCGSINTLKAMTGQDPIRLERKHQQAGNFVFQGMVIMASNENLVTTDHSSGLERRRITVSFDRRATAAEKLDWQRRGGEEAVLHSELPGLVNWLLELSQEEITDLIRNPPIRTKIANFEAMKADNSLVEWATDWCIPDPDAWTQVGDKREIRESGVETKFEHADERLYPNYLTWCQRHNRSSVSSRLFREKLVDALKTLNIPLREQKLAVGMGIYGIRLRREWEPAYTKWAP